MDPQTLHTLMTTVQSVEASLDTAPDSWPQHLEAIRSITAVFEITDTRPDDARRRWQLPLIRLAQRVAFADADHGPTTDMADWCLRQLLTLLPVYPNNVEILACKSSSHPRCCTLADCRGDGPKLVVARAKGTSKHRTSGKRPL